MITNFADNQRFEFPGMPGRFPRIICADNRPGMRTAAVRAMGPDAPPPDRPVTTGTDEHGAYFQFKTQPGDQSANDRVGKQPNQIQQRAMISFDGGPKATPNDGRSDGLIEMRFGLMLLPGPQTLNNIGVVLAQWNAAPGPGLPHRPPPACLYLLSKGKPRSQEREEWLVFAGNRLDPATGKVVETPRIMTEKPVPRGRYWNILLRVRDGHGGPGFLEMMIDGQSKGTYQGPIGYEGYSDLYPAFGSYSHNQQVPFGARFYGWREDVKSA